MMKDVEKIKFEVVEEIAQIGKCCSSPKLLRLISWNGYDPKLDLRIWYNNGKYPQKGITLTMDEGRSLMAALIDYFDQIDQECTRHDEIDFDYI